MSMSELVRTAVSMQLGCHPDALIYRYVEVEEAGRVGPGGSRAEVICLATSRQLVSTLMDAVRASKLEPVGMHPECLATLRAFDDITRRAEDVHLTTLYVDIGAGTTKVAI